MRRPPCGLTRLGFSTDLDLYRQYLRDSRGEFTVAKDQKRLLLQGG